MKRSVGHCSTLLRVPSPFADARVDKVEPVAAALELIEQLVVVGRGRRGEAAVPTEVVEATITVVVVVVAEAVVVVAAEAVVVVAAESVVAEAAVVVVAEAVVVAIVVVVVAVIKRRHI